MASPAHETSASYKSILGCEICAKIPQKIAQDFKTGDRNMIPAEVDRLLISIEIEDENTPSYCTSLTRLLKCPLCGTYYYYNHYEDEGTHFMDPTYDQVVIRRYDPITTMDFLTHILGDPTGVLPNSLGQLVNAFLQGTSAPTTRAAGSGTDKNARSARLELEELNGRYGALIQDFIHGLEHPTLDWQIKMYFIETLCAHYLTLSDWDSFSRVLLHHADPVVRDAAARLAISVGTGDAPVLDLIHTSGAVSTFLKGEIAKKNRMDELAGIFLDLVFNCSESTFEYDQGFGSSKYCPRTIRSLGLYSLVVAADHRADLVPAVPALMGLLSKDKSLNYQVCWVLEELIKKKKKAPQAILDEFEKISPPKKKALLKDNNVNELVNACSNKI